MSEKDLLVPDIGDFENVEIIELHVAVGDSVEVEDAILTLESDKATMDIPSPFAGKIKSLAVKVGDRVSEGSKLGIIETDATESASAPAAASPCTAVG